jgi:hypothetical protein
VETDEQHAAALGGRLEVLPPAQDEATAQGFGTPDADLRQGGEKAPALGEKDPGEPPWMSDPGLARRPSMGPAAATGPQHALGERGKSQTLFRPGGGQQIERPEECPAARGQRL